MFRNYLTAALRNLARNKLYTSINIIGLAIGLAAALLIALFVRDELSYDKFIPGHQRSYLLTYQASVPGRSLMRGNKMPPELAAQLKLEIPGIEAIARLGPDKPMLRHQNNEGMESVYWADPAFFSVVSLPVVAGDLVTALSEPNGIVLSRRLARKYFGREDVVGQTLELNGREGWQPMQVKAVLEDLPSNTHLNTEILASGRASFSGLTWFDTHWRDMHPNPADDFSNEVYVYMKLTTGTSIEIVRSALPDFLARHKQLASTLHLALELVPLADIHLHPSVYGAMKPPGSLANLYGLSVVGILIVIVAVINFVNLSTAQANGRAMEVGVRKTVGATRRDLAAQFIGESLLQVAIATVLAISCVELFMPIFNAFLQRTISLWSDPLLLGAIPITVLLVGILAALYPAAILSAPRPIDAMGKHVVRSGGSAVLRQTSVAVQFAVLIGLVLSTLVIYRQTVFATAAAIRLNTDQVLLINADCASAFRNNLQASPGVKDISCSRDWPKNENQSNNFAHLTDGSTVLVERIVVDAESFHLYGLVPLAGRFFSSNRTADALGKDQTAMQAPLVINETAVHRFGFASPVAAIGQFVTIGGVRDQTLPSEIIGVVADFPRDSVRGTVAPSVFFVEPAELNLLNVKLTGHDIPETLKTIDKLWTATTNDRPISRVFLHQYIQDQYADLQRDAVLLSAFATVALSVAALGLFALSAFTAERRTKEIGIRKAMGAGTAEVMRLLVWQFTKPVLWANLIAWPIAAFVMNRWLHGFAYHIDLKPWLFVVASASALIIALLTVSAHCYGVARAKPVAALRYE